MGRERAIGRRHLCRHRAADELLGPAAILDQVRDGEDEQAVPGRIHLQLRQARHAAVRVLDLAEDARRRKPRQLRQINGRLRMARARQHPTRLRAQRPDVAGPQQVRRPRRRVHERANGCGLLLARDTGRRAAARVHRHREGRAMTPCVPLDHQGQIERLQPVRRHRHAHPAARVGLHKVDRLGRDALRRHHEVALVFTVLVIHHDHHPPVADRRDRFFRFAEFHCISP